ncbi:hypothetical protein DGMP_06430 [Desulfomarina profundi]|uniref:DNA primase/helicase Gp4 N-terminal Bacteriophage T7-like domain-containing protein n=1 Tax=Desulfomarina profundi TaxID=2772557 RepID=A0A8D5FG59_9BACT|nr:hypothetical protein [Desulfomarina profundi]BCL59950.1 hypothetical protein DGMP_06430 [Desulfomarina profundi]
MTDILTYLESAIGYTPKKISTADGGEYASACPACGDGGKGRKSDRFHIWPEKENKGLCKGRFWCRQCGISGDTISFLQKFVNMNFQQACSELGIVLPKNTGGRKRGYQPSASLPEAGPAWRPKTYPHPAPKWQEKAENLLADCRDRLKSDENSLAWLADRGITAEMADIFRLGYNQGSRGGDRYRPTSAWGLPERQGKDGRPGRIWIPRGWVIPAYDDQGHIIQVRIRRLDEDIKKFAGNIKYYPVSGSSMATMVIYPSADVFVVVECGFDAILIAGAMGGGRVGAITTWNVSARPDTRAHGILSSASLILNGLDYDRAGEKEQSWWNKTYPQNRRLPQPKNGINDPGEAFSAGVNIQAWIKDSLPRGLRIKLGYEANKPGVAKTVAGNNKQQPAGDDMAPDVQRPLVTEMTLSNGKVIYLTDDREEWKKLTRMKKPVFTARELASLKKATSTMDEKERLAAAMQVIELKETISGFIRDGRVFDKGVKTDG